MMVVVCVLEDGEAVVWEGEYDQRSFRDYLVHEASRWNLEFVFNQQISCLG